MDLSTNEPDMQRLCDIISEIMSCRFPHFYANIELEKMKEIHNEKNYLPFIINFFNRGWLYGLR